jgi:hypothetical protein
VDYLLFRDSVERSYVILQGDGGERVNGGGDSGERSREDACHRQSRQTRILHRKTLRILESNLEQILV